VRKPIVSKAPVWKAATLAAVLGLALVPYPAHAAPALRQIEDIAFAERVVGVFARAVGEGSAAIQEDGKLIGRHP